MKELNIMAKEINEKMIKKGFNNKTFVESCMLIVTEVSEAVEEFRIGKSINETYYKEEKPAKPEGIPSELADIIIRVLHLCGQYDIDIEEIIDVKMGYNETRKYMHGKNM